MWLCAAVLGGLLGVLPARAVPVTNLVSRPVGYVRLTVPAGGYIQAAMPFEPFAPGIDDVLAGQLTGASTPAFADLVEKWLPMSDGVWCQDFYKCAGTGDPARDGRWLKCDDGPTPTSMTIDRGEGFWVINMQSVVQQVLLAGEVPLLDQKVVSGGSDLQGYPFLLGYPFAVSLLLSDARIDPSNPTGMAWLGTNDMGADHEDVYTRLFGDGVWRWYDDNGVLANRTIPVGQGVWFYYYDGAVAWTNTRPYAAPFPTGADHRPRIVGIRPSAAPGGVDVSLLGTGVAGERLDIFWQDAARTNGFQALAWTLADTVSLTAPGTNVWTDVGDAIRPAPGSVPLRFYLLGRTDTDSDADSLPDPREHYVHRTNPAAADSDGDGMPDGWETAHGLNPLAADATLDPDDDGLTNLQEYRRGTNPCKRSWPVAGSELGLRVTTPVRR